MFRPVHVAINLQSECQRSASGGRDKIAVKSSTNLIGQDGNLLSLSESYQLFEVVGVHVVSTRVTRVGLDERK